MNEATPSNDFEVNRWNVRRDILQAKLAAATVELLSHTGADAFVVPIGKDQPQRYIAMGTGDAIVGLLLPQKPTIVQ